MSDSHEPVTVTDKRRIDPETGEVRMTASGPAPSGPVPESRSRFTPRSVARRRTRGEWM